MAATNKQILSGLLILCAARVFAQEPPQSYGHECQDDEKDWMKGSQGPPWFFVKCEKGEAKACGFDEATERPDKPSMTICPGEFYEPSDRKLFTCVYANDAEATSKRMLVVGHYAATHDLKKVAKAIEGMRLAKLKAKPTPEYTAWLKRLDEWKKEHEAWQTAHDMWKTEHGRWQQGYDVWRQKQGEKADKEEGRIGKDGLKRKYVQKSGQKEPAEPSNREPMQPKSPGAEPVGPRGLNWYELRKSLLAELDLKKAVNDQCPTGA